MMPQYKRYKGFPRPEVDCSEDLKAGRMAVQSDAAEVDINKLVARAKKGLEVPTFRGEPFYGDVSELGGLQEAFIKVQESESLFMEYSADVRERFENDPVKFVDFLSDEKNRDEAVKLGLILAKPEVVIDKPVVPTPPAVGGSHS